MGYLYRGRHRKPSATARQAAALAVAGVTVGYPLSPAYAEAAETAKPDWGPIIACESGGDPKAKNPHSTASGLYQFLDSTWRHFGGTKYAPRAKDATPEQQTEIANKAFAAQGYTPWNASKHCWGGKVGKRKPAEKAETKKAPAPKAETKKQDAPKPEPKHDAPRYDNTPAPAPAPEPAPKPTPEPVPAPAAAPAPNPAPGKHHVVEKGDTLWDIAGGPGWVELYERNRDVVGADPNLIFPGQQLNL